MRRIVGAYRRTARDSLSLWRRAPIVPLIAVATEFAQHVVEIRLGMFASRAAFNALVFDPLRWNFGYAKLAGFWIAILASVLLTASRASSTTGLGATLRAIAWPRVLLALVLNALAVAATMLIATAIPSAGGSVINAVVSIATLPLLVYLAGALVNDRTMTLARAYTQGWLRLLGMALLAVPIFVCGQLVHRFDHISAIGHPAVAVWLLMTWDALWIGLLACATGAAVAIGYDLIPTRARDGAVDR